MITAVDTSVLLDVFRADPTHVRHSVAALRKAMNEGRLVVCEVVWSEVASCFQDATAADAALEALRVDFEALGKPAAHLAGAMWRAYRARGGPRDRMVPDFLIGAHALRHADRLLTRDRGFYRRYFADLPILAPGAAQGL